MSYKQHILLSGNFIVRLHIIKRAAFANREIYISENAATLKSSVVNEALCRIKGQRYLLVVSIRHIHVVCPLVK
jgi:hypothetical protein